MIIIHRPYKAKLVPRLKPFDTEYKPNKVCEVNQGASV